MTKRQFWERAYLRACSLPTSGFLSSDLASRTIKGEPLGVEKQKIDIAVGSLLEVVAQRVQVGCLDRNACLKADIPVGEEAPASGFEQLVDRDPRSRFVHGDPVALQVR